MLKLNLGCSDDYKVGYVNVDRVPPADQIADLRMRWPWEDSSVDEIYAHDVFEHLYPVHVLAQKAELAAKVWAMNEAWRVLKPGGLLDLAVPCVALADGRINPGAFADPTHVSFWTMDDCFYFCEEWNTPRGERGRLGTAYGIQALFKRLKWDLVEYGERGGRRSKILALLEAVK